MRRLTLYNLCRSFERIERELAQLLEASHLPRTVQRAALRLWRVLVRAIRTEYRARHGP
jgi:hypothetical protein